MVEMPTDIHPGGRRIVGLIIVIGAGAVLIALVYTLFNLGSGVTLPFARTPLDIGWLLAFGLMWLIVGVLLWWWLRPGSGASDPGETLQQLEKRLTQFQQLQTAQTTHEGRLAELDHRLQGFDDKLENLSARLADLDKAFQRLSVRLERLDTADTPGMTGNRALDLDHEVDNLATSIHDAHTRLDSLSDVNSRLDDLTSQVDSLYVTLQDVHQRLDGIEEGRPGKKSSLSKG